MKLTQQFDLRSDAYWDHEAWWDHKKHRLYDMTGAPLKEQFAYDDQRAMRLGKNNFGQNGLYRDALRHGASFGSLKEQPRGK